MEKAKRNKILKWALGIVGGLAVLLALYVATSSLMTTRNERIASHPDRILSEVGIKLPDYVVVDETDNTNGETGTWSKRSYALQLEEPFTEKYLEKLDRLVAEDPHWKYEEDAHYYIYEAVSKDKLPADGQFFPVNYGTCIHADEGKVLVWYAWHEEFHKTHKNPSKP